MNAIVKAAVRRVLREADAGERQAEIQELLQLVREEASDPLLRRIILEAQAEEARRALAGLGAL